LDHGSEKSGKMSRSSDEQEGLSGTCRLFDRVRERDRIGVWGFGNVSRDVVFSLIDEGLGKEIVYYSRPKEGYPNRAAAWVRQGPAASIWPRTA